MLCQTHIPVGRILAQNLEAAFWQGQDPETCHLPRTLAVGDVLEDCTCLHLVARIGFKSTLKSKVRTPLRLPQLQNAIKTLKKAAVQTIGFGMAFERIENEQARDGQLAQLRLIESKQRELELQLQPKSPADWMNQAAEWLS